MSYNKDKRRRGKRMDNLVTLMWIVFPATVAIASGITVIKSKWNHL